MEELYLLELPRTSAEIQQVFLANSGLSSASIRTIWNRLRIFWSWAESEGICSDVMKGVAVPVMKRKLPRVLRRDEIHKLLGSVAVERDYAILAALLDTGMRIGELASMTRACELSQVARAIKWQALTASTKRSLQNYVWTTFGISHSSRGRLLPAHHT